eukprot:Rmarinus@m.4903
MVSLFQSPSYNTIGDPYVDPPLGNDVPGEKLSRHLGKQMYTTPAKSGQLQREIKPGMSAYIPDLYEDRSQLEKRHRREKNSKVRGIWKPTGSGELITDKTSVNYGCNEGTFGHYEWMSGAANGSRSAALPVHTTGTKVSSDRRRNVNTSCSLDKGRVGLGARPLEGKHTRHMSVDHEAVERANRAYRLGLGGGFRPGGEPSKKNSAPFHATGPHPRLFGENQHSATSRMSQTFPNPRGERESRERRRLEKAEKDVAGAPWRTAGPAKKGNPANVGIGPLVLASDMSEPFIDEPVKALEQKILRVRPGDVRNGVFVATNAQKTREVSSIVYGRRNYVGGLGCRV